MCVCVLIEFHLNHLVWPCGIQDMKEKKYLHINLFLKKKKKKKKNLIMIYTFLFIPLTCIDRYLCLIVCGGTPLFLHLSLSLRF